MKKNVAIAMSAMMMAGTVVPAFANEAKLEGNQTVNVDIVDGTVAASREEKALETQKLEAMESQLEDWKKQTYTNEDGEVKNVFNIKIEKELVEDKDTTDNYIDKSNVKITVNKIFGDKDDFKTVVYTFNNVKGLRPAVDPGFGQNGDGSEDISQTYHINYATTDGKSKVQRLIEAVKGREDLKIRTRALKYDEVKKTADYIVTISSRISGKDLAIVNIFNAPIDHDNVILPSNTDFDGHWAQANIENAMINEWIDLSSTFRPNDQITRAEFVKIVNKAFGIPASVTPRANNVNLNGFTDVNSNNWFYSNVAAAVNAGYIDGYEKTEIVKDEVTGEVTTVTVKEFRPNQPITRQEAAKIVSYVMEEQNLDANGIDIKTDFADDKDIANWADQAVQNLVDQKVTNGYADKTFRPNNKITRAEALVMMDRAITVK